MWTLMWTSRTMKLAQSTLVISACLLSFSAHATEVIKVNSAAIYADRSVGNEKVRSECEWDRGIVRYLVKYSRGRVQVTDQDLNTVNDPTLRIEITSVHTAGGGGFSGPKWGNIRAVLFENGKQIYSFNVVARSQSGSGTACGTLNRIAKSLGVKLAKRLRSVDVHTVDAKVSNEDETEQAEEGDESEEDEKEK